MIESRFSTDRRVLFREVFTPNSIAKNGGVITGGVTLENGVATMDGTGYITYSGNKDLANKSQFTIRVKARRSAVNKQVIMSFSTDANNRVELLLHTTGIIYAFNSNGTNRYGSITDPYNDSDLHDFFFVFDGSGATNPDKSKLYIDGVNQILSFNGAVPTETITLGTFYIGKGQAGNTEGSFELVEIYDGCMTPEEVSLLHDNRLYSGFTNDGLILFADYTRGSSRNLAREYGDNVITNGTFNDGSIWQGLIFWSIADGYATATAATPGNWMFQPSNMMVGKRYKVTYTLLNYVSGSVTYRFGANNLTTRNANGSYVEEFIYTGGVNNGFMPITTFTGSIDNVSVQEVLESTDTDILYKHGLGAEFNGSTSVTDYGSPNIFDFGTEDLTIEMVYCPTIANFKPMLSKYNANIGVAWYTNSGKQRLYFGDGTSVNGDSNTASTIGLFHHYLVSMDRSGLATFYLDGNADGTLDISGKSGDINTIISMLVGDYSSSTDLSGFIRYTRIYKGKVLSALEVRQNYQAAIDSGYLK